MSNEDKGTLFFGVAFITGIAWVILFISLASFQQWGNIVFWSIVLGVYCAIGALFEDDEYEENKLIVAAVVAAILTGIYFSENGYYSGVPANKHNAIETMLGGGVYSIVGFFSVGAAVYATGMIAMAIITTYQVAYPKPSPKPTQKIDAKKEETFAFDPNRFKKPETAKPQPTKKPAAKKKAAPKKLTALDELNAMTGLEPVKDEIKKIRAKIIFDQKRKATGATVTSQSLHMVFTGNPGTGKTTVARIVGKALNELGVLKKATVHEVTREDLVAEYVGQTAPKTAAAVKKAMDGVLFIDEAYSLSGRGSDKDFGLEAIETLLKEMENNRDRIVVIVAGYKKDMEQFINSNPGLKSRFKNMIDFPDYNGSEMYQIFGDMSDAQDFTLDENASALLFYYLADLYENKDKNFGNARDVRNLLEACVSNIALRTQADTKTSAKALSTITAADIPAPDSLKNNSKMRGIWAKIQNPETEQGERKNAIDLLNKGNEKAGWKRLTDIRKEKI